MLRKRVYVHTAFTRRHIFMQILYHKIILIANNFPIVQLEIIANFLYILYIQWLFRQPDCLFSTDSLIFKKNLYTQSIFHFGFYKSCFHAFSDKYHKTNIIQGYNARHRDKKGIGNHIE